MIERLPDELINQLQPLLDMPSLKSLSQVNKRFFKLSHAEKLARMIKAFEEAFQQLKNDINIINLTLNGQLEYLGNFRYHFVLVNLNGISTSDDEIVKKVVQLTHNAAVLRLEIIRTNLYVETFIAVDDLIRKTWGKFLAGFSTFIPSNLILPEELALKIDALPKKPVAPVVIYLGASPSSSRNELKGLYMFLDASTPSLVLSKLNGDGTTMPQRFGSPPMATREAHIKALENPIPSFLKLAKSELKTIDQLLAVLNTIKESKQYQKHIQFEWEIGDIGEDPLADLFEDYYRGIYPQEHPLEVGSIIKFINHTLENHPNLELVYAPEEIEKNSILSCSII
ncbi:hypothetical protein [Legionella brunensis]|uniref:F-box domain-containing protein n=1 Tax=Legionella brunensis TaxID=29422 RepID=A0A0W0SMM7_9GAMM|nr:hypothetical protein [Legionella brunensis]KTC84489.1 hypothetical protein Lbru_1357 [Legionella brunensis]